MGPKCCASRMLPCPQGTGAAEPTPPPSSDRAPPPSRDRAPPSSRDPTPTVSSPHPTTSLELNLDTSQRVQLRRGRPDVPRAIQGGPGGGQAVLSLPPGPRRCGDTPGAHPQSRRLARSAIVRTPRLSVVFGVRPSVVKPLLESHSFRRCGHFPPLSCLSPLRR